MNKRLDNKGFTLVELLAVLVILIAIMAIAIPSISSSLERNKATQDEVRARVVASSAEGYITDHKNELVNSDMCYITIDELVSNGYLSSDDVKDSNDEKMSGVVIYDRNSGAFSYETRNNGYNSCLNLQTVYQEVHGTIVGSEVILDSDIVGSSYSFDQTTGKYTLLDTKLVGDINNEEDITDKYKYVCANYRKTTCSELWVIFKIDWENWSESKPQGNIMYYIYTSTSNS